VEYIPGDATQEPRGECSQEVVLAQSPQLSDLKWCRVGRVCRKGQAVHLAGVRGVTRHFGNVAVEGARECGDGPAMDALEIGMRGSALRELLGNFHSSPHGRQSYIPPDLPAATVGEKP